MFTSFPTSIHLHIRNTKKVPVWPGIHAPNAETEVILSEDNSASNFWQWKRPEVYVSSATNPGGAPRSLARWKRSIRLGKA